MLINILIIGCPVSKEASPRCWWELSSGCCLRGLLTFKYVSPLTSYRNWHSVLFRMDIVEPLTWILKAGNAKQINENLTRFESYYVAPLVSPWARIFITGALGSLDTAVKILKNIISEIRTIIAHGKREGPEWGGSLGWPRKFSSQLRVGTPGPGFGFSLWCWA